MKTKDFIICGLFAAITAILAQISIPFPGGVPLTMQTLAISLAGIILGSKRGFISILVYVLLGAIGLPVYAGFTGGISILLGPTGGFLLSFPIMAYIIGLASEKTSNNILIFLSITIGSIINYLVGAAQFSIVTNSTFIQALILSVLPFVIVGLVKSVLAQIIGLTIRNHKALKEILS